MTERLNPDRYRPIRILDGRGWCGDDCECTAFIDDTEPDQAIGIMTIHRSCYPPCPRARAAMSILERLADAEKGVGP
jgi:hypothetical protein